MNALLRLTVSFAILGMAGAAADAPPLPAATSLAHKDAPREAYFYEKSDAKGVKCLLCPHGCALKPGETGFCKNYRNTDGKLLSLVYGKPCSVVVEDIEKAPFYHFLPGSKRVCVATAGCNFRCSFCQNWQISQCGVEDLEKTGVVRSVSPEQIVKEAKQRSVPTICFTFNEPVNFYDYMYDISVLAHKEGIKTVMVSNGYINEEPLRRLLPVLDAVKVDFKAFDEGFYEKITAGELEPVLRTMRIVREARVHLEIVNLVIPTLNDKEEQIRKMAEWIMKNVGPDVPTHFTRFTPLYKLAHLPPTPPSTLEMCAATAKKAGLKYVYIGNLPGSELNSTFCASCGKKIISRTGFHVVENKLKDGACPFCEAAIPGVWK